MVYRDQPIQTVPLLTLEPAGCTALLDALGRFITEGAPAWPRCRSTIGPETLTVVVITDGMGERQHRVDHRGRAGPDRPAGDGVRMGLRLPRRNMDAVGSAPASAAADKSLTHDADAAGVVGALRPATAYQQSGSGRAQPTASIAFDEAGRRAARKQT